MNALETLKLKYCQLETQINEFEVYFEFVIVNPNNKDNITVDNTSGMDQSELTFYFSYQHAHFSDIRTLISYIDLFLADSEGAIEFYRNGKNAYGGSISLNNINVMWADDLSR